MTRTKSQSNFAIVETLLVVIIIAIVGFTGWYVWHSKQATEASLNAANKSSQSASVPSIKQPTTFAECKATAGSKLLQTAPEQCVTKSGKTFTDDSSSSFLAIKEWNVKVPLTASISGVNYNLTDFDPNVAFLNATQFTTTSCASANGGIAFIQRFLPNAYDGETKQFFSTEYPNAVKLGSYYYGLGINPAYETCSLVTSIQNQVNAAREALKQSLIRIQQDK